MTAEGIALKAGAVLLVASFVYLWGYETTRYVIWWRFHNRFAWWKTIREEWHRL